MPQKISQAVLAVLSAAVVLPEVNGQSGVRLTGQLDRKLYVQTNEVLEALGGTWNRKAKAHLFKGDAAVRLESAILTGEVTDPKREFGAFFTPDDVAAHAATKADLRAGLTLLEPSAGHGVLAERATLAGCVVDCVELQQDNAAVLERGLYRRVIRADFLKIEPAPAYDRILMNPPFAAQADIDHVSHALHFLKPGGKLAAIMSAGVTFREDRKARKFRETVEQHGGTIEALPEDSFKAAGTSVRTVLVSLTVPEHG